MPAKTIVS